MPFLTVTASQEEQVNSFSRFLKSLTWEKVLPAAVILAVSLVLIKILTTLFGKAIARSKLDETLRPWRARCSASCSTPWRCWWSPAPWVLTFRCWLPF